MSSERPPSQDSIEGNGIKISTTTIINSTAATSTTTGNMVLSAIPLDSGHVVIQQSATGSRIATLTNSPSTHHHHQQQQQQQQIQQHIHQQNGSNGVITGNYTQQIHRNNTSPTKIITTTTGGHHSVGPHSITKIIGTSNGNGSGGGGGGGTNSASSSKYVIFQPNGHYTTNDAFIGQSNGVGNIVIVATESMDINHPEHNQQLQHQQITAATGTTIINGNSNGGGIIATSDEELTSLTWLTDKNLIKGLVACTNKNAATVQGIGNSPGRQINCINSNNHVGNSNGCNGNITSLSPTSDFMEDSSVSDENLSSANSSTTDQGICVKQNNINEYTGAIHLHKSQQHHIQYTNNNNNNNNKNNMINKNRNNIISPINTTNNSVNFTTNTSTNNNLIQQIQETHHINGNLAAALGATTTTVHVGPSGTTTVVEYKSSNKNYLQSSSSSSVPVTTAPTTIRHIPNNQQQVPHSTINSSTTNLSTISPITQQNNKTINNSFNPIVITSSTIPKSSQNLINCSVSSVPLVAVSPVTTIPTQPTTATTTHHPHKKYLREQMNGMNDHQQQQQQQNCNNNINNNVTTNNLNGQYTSIATSNIIPYSGSSTSSVGNLTTPSKMNNNQSILTIAESPPHEYHQQPHSTPNNYSEYDNDSLKDFEMPNGNLSSSSSSNGRISSSAQKHNNTSSSSGSLSPSKQKHPTNMPYDPYVHTNSKPPYSFSSLIFMAIEDSPEKALPVKEIYAWIVHHFPYFKTAPTGWKNSVRHNLSLNKSFLKVEKAPNMGKGSLWRVEQLQRPNLIQALARSPFHPCTAVDKHLQQHKNSQIGNTSSVKYTSNSGGIDSPPMTPVKSNLDAKLFPKLSKMIREIITKSDAMYGVDGTDNLGLIDNNDGTINYNNNNNNSNILNKNMDGIKTNTDQNYENVERLARDCGADSIDDVNAATAMLALKHGPKVFTETFNNGSPVITNSPSEDHTYSAGGGSSGNGGNVGNIIIVGSSGVCSSNSSVTGQIGSHNGSDNVSNGVSSDAAYESSEESHNISAEELEQQRRVEGVDALLSLSSMFDISATPSPIKRPSSSIIEEEHISSYMENIPHLNGKGILAANSTIDEGYNTPASYYSHIMSNPNVSAGSLSGSLPKKLKQSRGIRAKIKRKTAWIR